MPISSQDILDQMAAIRYEPTRMQALASNYVESVWAGEQTMVDPSLPFPYLIEISCLTSVAAIQRDEVLNARQYAVMANDEDSLYYQMSDKDFLGNFDSPAQATFDIFMSLEEIMQYAVKVGTTGTKRITLPKHSQILINNVPFTMQYPVNLIIKSHGGLDIVYDAASGSPLQVLRGNKIPWEIIRKYITENNVGLVELVRIPIVVKQMLLTSYKYSLTGTKSLKKVLALTDNFYYCRAFSLNSNTKLWDEIKTTHSLQVFDPTDPTLLLKVVEGELTVELPYVYYATSLATGTIRVDVYTTKGDVVSSMSGQTSDAFKLTFRDLDNDDNGIYSAPLGLMATISVLSSDTISGGSSAPVFTTRRRRVLTNAVGDSVLPISDAQMGTELEELGFDCSMVVDNVTERVYLATRAMPDNTQGQVTTGIDAAVLTQKISITDLLKYETVIDNGTKFTITPKTLYRNLDGVLTIVSDADRKALALMTPDALVNKVSDGTYLYTPLHYSLDISGSRFTSTPYYLDAPAIDVTSFIASNDTLSLTVGSGVTRSITRDEDGYQIDIVSSSNDIWKALHDDQVHVQLAFKPAGESTYAYINGTLVGVTGDKERIYRFRLNSNWLLDDTLLTLTNFNMFEPVERDYQVDLDTDYSLIWSVSDYTIPGAETTEVDEVIGKFLLPEGAVGVYHETLNVHLGDELDGLWARARSMISTRKYLTYQSDVYAFYDKDEYATDPTTGQPIIEVVNGVKQLKVAHKKGDQKFNADGKPTVKYAKGSVIKDEYGNPTLESERNITRWWDMCLFDGVYRFATDLNDVAYVKSVPLTIVDWINDALGGLRVNLLERTDLLYQPRNTLKYIECLVNDSETVTLNTAQQLKLVIYVTKTVYTDLVIRAAIEKAAIQKIVESLNDTVIARDQIQDAIRAVVGVDVTALKLTGLGGMDKDYDVITILDESARLVIGKSLKSQADGTAAVIDGIEVDFKMHTVRQ